MYFNNIDFTVVYIDPSIATAGDGTSPLTALKTFPSSLSEKTCYLIRRTATATKLTLIYSDNSINNSMIIGMPKQEDEIYYLMPDEAKTAWGSDTAEYANLLEPSGNSRINFSAIQLFIGHRLNVFRTNENHQQYLFSFNKGDTDYTGSISFTNCKFEVIDLSIPDESNTTLFGNTTCGSRYIGVNSIGYFTFKNNIMDYYGDDDGAHRPSPNMYDGYAAHGIAIRRSGYMIDVSNNKIYTTTRQYNYPNYAIALSDEDKVSPIVYADNITVEIFKHQNKPKLPNAISGSYFAYLRFRNFNLSFNKLKTFGDASSLNIYCYHNTIELNYLREFHIENINIDVKPQYHIGNHNCIISILCYPNSWYPGYERIIKTVNISLAENTTDNPNIGSVQDEVTVSNSGDSGRYHWDVAMRICCGGDMGNSYIIESGDNQYYNRMQEPLVISDITINALRAAALYADGVQIINANIRGGCRFKNCIVNIQKLESYYPSNILYAIWNTTCYIGEIVACVDNPDGMSDTGYIIGSGISDRQHIYVGKANRLLREITQSTSSKDNCYTIVCASEQNDGHFIQRTGNITCETFNVNRTGGAEACLKLWSNSYNSTSPLQLGYVPFKGRLLNVTDAGAYILKIYVAFKAFSGNPDIYGLTDLFNRLNIDVDTPKDSLTRNYYNSTLHGRWTKDTTSTWNNDSGDGFEQALLEIPVKVETAGDINVAISYSYYDPTGYFYIDPNFELVKITQ